MRYKFSKYSVLQMGTKFYVSLHKICAVNVTISTGNFGFGHIY